MRHKVRMNLEYLELADRIIREANFVGTPLDVVFAAYQRPREEFELIERLLADGQFYVLIDLKRAEEQVMIAFERLTPQTEYLRGELEKQLEQLHLLLQKVEREEHLRRDRDALLSPPA